MGTVFGFWQPKRNLAQAQASRESLCGPKTVIFAGSAWSLVHSQGLRGKRTLAMGKVVAQLQSSLQLRKAPETSWDLQIGCHATLDSSPPMALEVKICNCDSIPSTFTEYEGNLTGRTRVAGSCETKSRLKTFNTLQHSQSVLLVALPPNFRSISLPAPPPPKAPQHA